jgi:NTP pyrophosphatase (non-canonical NTP hydrolase)
MIDRYGHADGSRECRPVTTGTGEFSIGGQVWAGLSKLIEEAAEVGQVAGKIIGARGETIHFDGSNLRDRLTEELGDLLAAVDFVIGRNDLPLGVIQRRRYTKRATFEAWHEGRDDVRSGLGS